MSSERPPPIRPPPPAEAGSDWLFQRSGQIFGPVSTGTLIQMLYRGEVTGATPVAGEDGRYRSLAEIPTFLLHVKKAEAQLRVEAEVTGARLLRRRRRLQRATSVAVLAALLLGVGAYGAYWLATARPWQQRSALLEDFGDGIFLAMPARVGGGRHATGAGEVEVPIEAQPSEVPPSRRAAAPPASGNSSPTKTVGGPGGEVVAAHYDKGSIEAVADRERRTLVSCVLAESHRSPDFRGDIPIEFAIGNDGRVAQLWIDEPRFKHGELYDCLLRTLKTWPFKPFPGERPTVSLSFRIGAR